MKELNLAIEHLLVQLHGIWVRRRYIILTAWLFCPLGWYVVYQLPPTYEASAKVYFDTQTILEPLLQGLTVTTNSQQQVQALARTVLTRPNLENVAKKVDLDAAALSPAEYERLIDKLEENLKLRTDSNLRSASNIYTLTYFHEDPRMALKVVQEMLNVFIESRLGNSRSDQQSAERFLSAQIADYELRLLDAERKRSEFRRNQMSLLSGGEANYYGRITSQESLVAQTQLEVQELEVRQANLRRDIQNLSSMSRDGRAPETQFDARISEGKARLDELKMRFTDNHPDVIEVSRLIERLEKQRDDELALIREASGANGDRSALMQSTLYENLVTTLSQLDGEIASRKLRIKSIQENIESLRSQLHLIPQIEAEYAALNRDYEINKSNYEELLARRESAEMARKVDASESQSQFRVIEPPRVPLEPSGPKRVLFYTIVLFMGVAAGIAIAFLRNLISPVLSNPLQLKAIADFPIFGIISHIDKAAIVRQNRLHLLFFVILSGMLFMAYLVLIGNEIFAGKLAATLTRFL